MSTVPTKLSDKLNWYEAHIAVWSANAAAVGLTAAQATALATAIGKARDKYTELVALREQA